MKTFLKIFAVLSIVFVLAWQEPGYAKTNSLVILDDKSEIDFTESAMALISTHCGEIYHVFKSKALMGYIPEDKVNLLIGRAGILNIYQNQTQPNKTDPVVNCAIKAFNNLLQPVKELTEEEIREKGLDQWKDETGITYLGEGSKTNLPDRLTSEYMIGRVAVSILIIEGNGDPQYDWTPWGMDSVTAQIIKGLDWLANKASEHNTNVCWFYEWRYSVPVNGEPINGPSGIEHTDEDNVVWWIAQAMSAIGYGSGDLSAVYSYVRDLRYTYQTDWAFTTFVVNGDFFQDGYSAWAMRWQEHYLYHDTRIHGGPYLVLTYNNGSQGLPNMYRVLRHETCHVFGAADEFQHADDCKSGDDCDLKWGYLQIENQNCYYCTGQQVPCIMINLYSGNLCIWTSYQMGWRDGDWDGAADPIDPNSHRWCWIGPDQVGGPIQPGDIIKTYTLDDFVKSIAVTPDNSICSPSGYCVIMWDGTNAWGTTCAPGLYLATLNDGSPHSIFLAEVDPSQHTPVFDNFQFQHGVLYWRLKDCWAYVRLKVYDSNNQLVLYPVKDKAYDGNTDNQTDLYGLTEGATYTAKFFGWGPAGHVSQVTEYSFVYHGPAVLSPNGGEEWEAQSTHDITWSFPGVSGDVRIDYSTNGGANWSCIVSSTPNDGSYAWTLPHSAVTLSDCKVKISGPFVWDVSDNSFSITPGPLYTPTNLSLSTTWGFGIRVQWTDNNINELGYKIERKDSTDLIWEEILSTGPNANWFQDTIDIVGSEVYWYRVRAYNEAGYSPYSEEKRVKNRPNPPSNFTVNTLCDNSNLLFLSWDPPENQKIPIEYYQLYITDLLKGDCERWYTIYGLGDTLCIDPDLEPGCRYLTTVRGFDEQGGRGHDAGPIEVIPGPIEQCSPELCQASDFEIFWTYVPGDANSDQSVSASDIVYIQGYLYRGGPPPCIPESGDPNADCQINAGDVVYLLSYLFQGGPPPQPGCWHGE